LQERFLLIQSGIRDEVEQLKSDIAQKEHQCKETKDTLETQIENDQRILQEAQTDLASGTQKEANAGEMARQTAAKHGELDKDLRQQMKTCNTNYVNFETEMCALKKIRGELYKMKGSKMPLFQDCVVAAWEPEECSKVCRQSGGKAGEQKLSRKVLTQPNKGAKCLPLGAIRKCNVQPCPVNCKLGAWAGWSKCSAECNGGVKQRLREVTQAMKFGGKPCGETSQTVSCNDQSCSQDCKLSEWTSWGWCSKACDGGTKKRFKWIKKPAQGAGKCAGKMKPERLQYKKCNQAGCLSAKSTFCSSYQKDTKMYTCDNVPTCCAGYQGMGTTDQTVQCVPSSWAKSYKVNCGAKAMKCKKKLDVVLLLDGSGSLRKKGWKAEIKAANLFVDAFAGSGAQSQMSVILYSGPRTYPGVRRCFRSRGSGKECNIKRVISFSKDMKEVKKKINNLEWPRGSTLTSLALLKAHAQLSMGRKDAKSVVVVITDGRPFSYRATTYVSRYVRKSARLLWVPVTRYAPLRWIKRWATNRWQENVVNAKNFKVLENSVFISKIIANMCPPTR